MIISRKEDFTSDIVCVALRNFTKNYLRVNRDELALYKIFWDISNEMRLFIIIDEEEYIIDEKIKGVYYRAPVFLRNFLNASVEEQISKTQWMAFIKNLIYYEDAIWINNPVATYKAENKMLQLKYAKKIGFKIPETFVVNHLCERIRDDRVYALKSIDTLFLKYIDKEAFLYTNMINGNKLKYYNLDMAPIVLQSFLRPKIDIRVTVINENVYSVKIVKNGMPIEGDWRKEKDSVNFVECDLPDEIKDKCIEMVKMMGLIYGAIDLALVDNEYYFLELNPTGEWAWLKEINGFDIDEKIVEVLINK